MSGELFEGALDVARRLRSLKFEAYLAGGCVRDILRNEQPKDYDVVTDATPDEVARIFKRTVLVGASFGVVRVLLGRGREYEVATYRKDSDYSDGRHPDRVEYSKSKEEDVERRDFTINALLMDPETREVLDFVGGREDLAAGVIRAVGDPEQRIAEDRLRMLRAVRFAARFGFAIEEKTLEAIRAEAHAIGAVSVERIVAELEGIFSSADPLLGLRLLRETGLWAFVLSFAPPEEALHERFARIPRSLSKEARVAISWALLLAGLGKDALEERMRSLKLSRAAMRTIARLIDAAALLSRPEEFREHERVKLAIDPERELFYAYARALGAGLDLWEQLARDLAERPLPELPLVTGEDLKKLGVPPGPAYKELLGAVEIEILERRITAREAALEFVRRLSGR